MLVATDRDCVRAVQFIADGAGPIDATATIEGEPVDERAIETLLRSPSQAPLGLTRDDSFRISVAGTQEKAALLWHEDRWPKPAGTTPTTHLFKSRIRQLANGIDLSNSVEKEFYCLKLIEALGMAVNAAEVQMFGETKSLAVYCLLHSCTGFSVADVLHQKQAPDQKVRCRDRTVGCFSTKETDHGTRSTP